MNKARTNPGRAVEELQPMMDIAVRRAARATARRLADQYPDSDLRSQVETALQTDDADARPQQYADPVAVGSLIVSAAGVAWGIYKDLREKTEKTPKPPANVIVIRVEGELKLSATDPVPPAQRARIIETVVEEILDDES
jgi:hypothetical protein